MTLFNFRAPKGFCTDQALREHGGDYLEFDEVLSSGSELGLEEDPAGYLTLIEEGEFE
jgi:hypothetical protein